MKKSSTDKKTKPDIPAKTIPTGPIETVFLIGCGGTGSYLGEHLARMIAGYRLEAGLVLYDGDTVEAANITRQNFHRHELGANKAEALALRLAGQFGLEIAANACPVSSRILPTAVGNLIITATDTLASRRLVAEKLFQLGTPRKWWLDVGNELQHGQAVLGNTHEEKILHQDWRLWNHVKRRAYVYSLPDIAARNPALLKARAVRSRAGCADQPFRQQGFGVNAMAALAAATLARQVLVEGVIRTAAIFFNVAEGRSVPQPITRDLYANWRKS